MDIGYDTVVVECKYFTDEDDDGDGVGATHGGGLGGETEHCFGSITVEPPIDLNTCTSLPSEITLEVRKLIFTVSLISEQTDVNWLFSLTTECLRLGTADV